MEEDITRPDFYVWAGKVLSTPLHSLDGSTSRLVATALKEAFDQGFVYGKRVGYELGREYPNFNGDEE